jgi:hypothetical protein
MSNRINAHITQLLLQPGVPVILYIIVCSSWHLCSNQRPSAQQKKKEKSANTTHSQISLFQNKNSCKYTNPKEKRKQKTSALKANMYVCAEWQSAKLP